jgi:tetratricopeptide (TPR) repeat protein
MESSIRKLSARSAALITAGVTFAYFLPVLGYGFVNWDDDGMLLENLHFRQLRGDNLKWMATTLYQGTYQPLSWLIDGLIYALRGLDPAAYHAANLLLHAAVAGLFCLVASRLLARARPPSRDEPACGLAAALLFALHPLQAESAAWVTAEGDLLASLFFMSAVLVYVSGRIDSRRLAATWLLFLLSGLSRWKGVSLPFVLLILDAYPLRRRAFAEKIPLFLLSAALVAVNALAKAQANRYGSHLDPGAACVGFILFLSKWLAPMRLMPVYDVAAAGNSLGISGVLAAVGVLALTAGFVVLRRRWPAGLAGWAFYLLALAPILAFSSSDGPIHMHDMHAYLACMGFPLLAAAGLERALDRASRPTAVFAIALALLLALGAQARVQAGVWRDSETLWRHALAIEPTRNDAIYRLGRVLQDEGRYDEAISLLRAQARTAPDMARANLVGLYVRRAEKEAAQRRWPEAAASYRAAAALAPESRTIKESLAQAEKERASSAPVPPGF